MLDVGDFKWKIFVGSYEDDSLFLWLFGLCAKIIELVFCVVDIDVASKFEFQIEASFEILFWHSDQVSQNSVFIMRSSQNEKK